MGGGWGEAASVYGIFFCNDEHILELDSAIGWLSRWLSDKEYACQCRRYGLNPWVGKMPWRREWQPTPVFLSGKFHGQRSLADCSQWGHKKSDMTEHTR